jgi:DNA sulfur modification protein DndB
MNEAKNSVFPSLRARIGDWTYYVTLMSLNDVAKWVKRANEIHEKKELKTWIQREMKEERLEKISSYLINQSQRFFNAIVVGIYGGDPDWFPVTVGKNPVHTFELNNLTEHSIGILKLEGSEEIFAVDGQHRVEGIKDAVAKNQSLGDEQICVIFVGHETNNEGRVRTRRLFTNLNKYARPVSEGEIVALDEDDAFAIVTRKIMDEYMPLKGFIEFSRTSNLQNNDKTSITTTVSLYQLIQILALPTVSRERNSLKIGPPNHKRIQQFYDDHCKFWDSIIENVVEIKEVVESKPSEMIAGKYRENGGHLLFRPVGQNAFGKAVRIMMDRGKSLDSSIDILGKINLQLNSEPWSKVLWNPSTKSILTKYKRLAQNLFLYMAGQELSPSNYDLLDQYRKIIADETAQLPKKIISE